MAKVFLISDGFFRDKFPFKQQVDVQKFYASQEIENTTSLPDKIGKKLTNNMFEYATGNVSPENKVTKELFEEVQMLMVFLTAQSLEDFKNDETNDNKVNAIKNKAEYILSNIKSIIKENDTLTEAYGEELEIYRESFNNFPTHFFK